MNSAMMGRKYREQANFFYEFRLDDIIPKGHLLRRINVFVTSMLGDLHEQLGPFYSAIGQPSIDPELLIRMLIVGYCFGIRSERKLCEEVKLHLAYRWFCRLDLNDAIPHHSTFSENRPVNPANSRENRLPRKTKRPLKSRWKKAKLGRAWLDHRPA